MAMPTGGTITKFGQYTVHRFNSNGTFVLPKAITLEYLVVGAGGTGGVNNRGGGGGGQVLTGTLAVAAGSYPVTIGQGHAWGGNNALAPAGAKSIFSTIEALGGRDGDDDTGATQYAVGGNAATGTGGSGGLGTATTFSGVELWYGSGGGGPGTTGAGAPGPSAGWGGYTGHEPTGGDANQGGGSGGQATGNSTNPAGGSGTVIIRYLTSLFNGGMFLVM